MSTSEPESNNPSGTSPPIKERQASSQGGEKETKETGEATGQEEEVVLTVDPPPGGIEREVFGKWSVLLRNIFGAVAVWTLCLAALANAWTTNVSVTTHGEWPSEISMIVMNVGPIVVAWTWMNSNKILSTLMELAPIGNKIRNRVAQAIAPKPPEDPPAGQ